MNKLTITFIVVLTIILGNSCCNDSYEKSYWVESKVTKIGIDDDGEYHITYISIDGNTYSESNLSNEDMNISYGNIIAIPSYKKRMVEYCDCDGEITYSDNYPESDNRRLAIPYTFIIDTTLID